MALEDEVFVTYRGKVAIITLNLPKKLNALTQSHYARISNFLREIAVNDDITCTVLTGKGRFFSAGANVKQNREVTGDETGRQHYLKSFAANNLEITHAFYTHPKILITALNGPAVGLSAALVGHSDFVYAAPHTFLLTPFSSLGLVAEGGASRAFVERLGISKANEALLMSKRIPIEDLVATGFVNKVFEVQPGEDDKFLGMVLDEVDNRLGDHLVASSFLKMKEQIRGPGRAAHDKAVVDEVMDGLARFVRGIPQKEFKLVASGQKKHKL